MILSLILFFASISLTVFLEGLAHPLILNLVGLMPFFVFFYSGFRLHLSAISVGARIKHLEYLAESNERSIAPNLRDDDAGVSR